MLCISSAARKMQVQNQPRTSATDVRGGHLRRTPPYFNTKTTISKEASAHKDGGNPVLRISSAARKMQVL